MADKDPIEFAVELIEAALAISSTVETSTGILTWGLGILKEGRDPTDAEWDQLNTQMQSLRDELHS